MLPLQDIHVQQDELGVLIALDDALEHLYANGDPAAVAAKDAINALDLPAPFRSLK